ncbi:hypothetical protein [Actinomadura flavalba]|uniref:hypothetical protein n=1 Tax=Actinomadura flavalba TaxID=1120938 RepID=UPI0003AA1072|nr:hypothetical protein [Actinomadura flavalba]
MTRAPSSPPTGGELGARALAAELGGDRPAAAAALARLADGDVQAVLDGLAACAGLLLLIARARGVPLRDPVTGDTRPHDR